VPAGCGNFLYGTLFRSLFVFFALKNALKDEAHVCNLKSQQVLRYHFNVR
jgi:hypothetical protein